MTEYWYCLKHQAVEPEQGCRNSDRLGPYPDQVSASHALERVAERNEEWDSDPAWNDDVSEA